ncbi:MAG: hypothetical protein JWL83_2405 [Actinomycetia bacterium]|nr:hypothetical protein [Actinomycetes bacterium]
MPTSVVSNARHRFRNLCEVFTRACQLRVDADEVKPGHPSSVPWRAMRTRRERGMRGCAYSQARTDDEPTVAHPMPQLRTSDHPDLSDFVVHLTGRLKVGAPRSRRMRVQSAEERLRQICIERRMRASKTFYAPSPVVCFMECTVAGLAYLIRSGRYAPWGIVFDKQSVWDRGGAP